MSTTMDQIHHIREGEVLTPPQESILYIPPGPLKPWAPEVDTELHDKHLQEQAQ